MADICAGLRIDAGFMAGVAHDQFANAVLLDDSKATCQLFEKLGGAACLVTKAKPALYHLKALAASG